MSIRPEHFCFKLFVADIITMYAGPLVSDMSKLKGNVPERFASGCGYSETPPYAEANSIGVSGLVKFIASFRAISRV